MSASTLKFTKMHGIGNDYVYVDTFEQTEPAQGWPALAQKVADRRFGVGGDGLILIERGTSSGAKGRMRMFNSDGSESEMCGNGLRCVAKYLHDRKYRGCDELDIDTGAGTLRVTILKRDDKGDASWLKINMGRPILEAARIPTSGRGAGQAETLSAGGRQFEYTAVSMGNPHCVIFVDDVRGFPVTELGPLIENNTALFPRRVNVEFVQVLSKTECIQRTWERGAGETLACGTGASAVAVAGQLRGHFGRDVLIHLSGGDLQIQWPGGTSEVLMSGGATHVFDGALDPRTLT